MTGLSDRGTVMRPALGLTLAIGVLASGCGTIHNFASGDPDVYGGVRNDCACFMTPGDPGPAESCGMDNAVLVCVVFADAALSAVADTLTLPLAIYLRQNEHAAPDQTAPAQFTTSQPSP